MKPLRLKKLRTDYGLTQSEVANRLQISNDAYSLYELGKRQMNYQTLHLLADMYNVSIDYLLGRDSSGLVQLNREETNIINQYRQLDERAKETLKNYLIFENSRADKKHSSYNTQKKAT